MKGGGQGREGDGGGTGKESVRMPVLEVGSESSV